MFIPVQSHVPTPTQTKHSRELGRRVEHLIREYQREYPELTEDEIRAALSHSSLAGDDVAPAVQKRRAVGVALGLAGLVAAGLAAMISSGGGGAVSGGGNGPLPWLIVAGLVAVLAGVAVLVAATRR